MNRKWILILGLGALALAGAWFIRSWAQQRLRVQTLDNAEAALQVEQWEEAHRLAANVLADDPDSSRAALVAAEASLQLEQPDRALAYLEPMFRSESGEGTATGEDRLTAMAAAADIHYQIGRATQAEQLLREVLEEDPDHLFALVRLAMLLTIQGRHWEAQPYRMELLRLDHFTYDDLLFLGNRQALVESPELEAFLVVEPDNPLPLLAKARIALRKNEPERARDLARQIIASYPDQLEAHATLGGALLEIPGGEAALPEWVRQLPENAGDHPGIWVVRGLIAQRQGDMEGAARSFWEALRLDPNHLVASYQLAASLAALGREEMAEPFQQRAGRLQEMVAIIDKVFTDRADLDSMRRAATLAESLGRYWEAWGWYRIVVLNTPDDSEAREALQRLQATLDEDVPLVLDEHWIARDVDLADYGVPEIGQAVSPQAVVDRGETGVRFHDVSAEAGIQMTYFNGDDPLTEGRRMFEFTGGGVAALDYDLDGWVDLYFTQGASWPPDPQQTEYTDRLFRNRGDGTFQDVTATAGVGDNRFSQGVAAGDYNNDGWPDLYVANAGVNRLYRNNGDGTFTDIAPDAGVDGGRWTTSCLIADLNGDGIPDLYEVNYLEGEDVFDLICNRGGRARSCSPTEFDAQQDRFYLGMGDGTFVDATDPAGIIAPNGKGLGLVAFDVDGSGRLSLFVANDTTANFFFANVGERGEAPQFQEEGIFRGLAYDRDGLAQACMGIAIDDADGDGLLDLFVTNFYNEANTLYLQQEGGFFRDDSRERALKETSFSLLGFGTQFLDGELDGRPDLVITNGHVDDFRFQGAAFQMPPQYFANLGPRFQDLSGPELGDYFERELLGRGLARLDYNRDGREDFAVSHLDAPVALVENRSSGTGHFLGIQLRGTLPDVERDAIGTTVLVTAGGRTAMRQMTAGDGYEASNERQLVFGLGDAETIDRLEVRWPDGSVQVWEEAIPVDRHLFIRQADDRLYGPPASAASPGIAGLTVE